MMRVGARFLYGGTDWGAVCSPGGQILSRRQRRQRSAVPRVYFVYFGFGVFRIQCGYIDLLMMYCGIVTRTGVYGGTVQVSLSKAESFSHLRVVRAVLYINII